MIEIRSKTVMLVGMLDESTGILHIKDGQKMWLIPVPLDGMTVTTVKGSSMPEETYIAHSASA
jgi:hypothetical protein